MPIASQVLPLGAVVYLAIQYDRQTLRLFCEVSIYISCSQSYHWHTHNLLSGFHGVPYNYLIKIWNIRITFWILVNIVTVFLRTEYGIWVFSIMLNSFAVSHASNEFVVCVYYMLNLSEGTETRNGNDSSSKSRTYPFYIVSIAGVNILATQGATEPSAMILTTVNRIISLPVR